MLKFVLKKEKVLLPATNLKAGKNLFPTASGKRTLEGKKKKNK